MEVTTNNPAPKKVKFERTKRAVREFGSLLASSFSLTFYRQKVDDRQKRFLDLNRPKTEKDIRGVIAECTGMPYVAAAEGENGQSTIAFIIPARRQGEK